MKIKTKKIFQIIPKDTNTFTLPNRVIGSGKITRRLQVVSRKKKFITRLNKSSHSNTPYKDKNLPIALNSKSKRIWQHWNSADSKTLTSHKDINGKTKQMSVRLINKALRKFNIEEIIAAIDLAAICFSENWFKPKPKKMNCFSFFEYNEWEVQNLAPPKEGRSWLAEFVKGVEYIETTYRKLYKDKNPEVTAQIEDIYRNNQQYYNDLTISEQNALIKCASKIVKFNNANNHQFDALKVIDRIINNPEKPFKLNNPHFLSSVDLWENQLPREMVRYDPHIRRSEIQLI